KIQGTTAMNQPDPVAPDKQTPDKTQPTTPTPPPAAEVALPNPVHQWSFDEGTGDSASDLFGKNTAILGFSGSGKPRWVEGKFGKALEFTTADQMANAEKY